MTRAQWPSRCGSSRCRGGGSEKEQPIRSAAESGEKVGTLHRPAYQLQDGLLGVGQTGDVVVGDGLAVVHNLVHDPVDELLVESPQRFGVAAAAAGSRSRRPGAADSRLVRHPAGLAAAGTPARGSLGLGLGEAPFKCGGLRAQHGRSDAGGAPGIHIGTGKSTSCWVWMWDVNTYVGDKREGRWCGEKEMND